MITPSIFRVTLFSFLIAVGCDSSDNAEPSASRAASDLFWSTYHDNGYAQIGDVQAALEKATQVDPNNAELYAYLAATHFWHVGEYRRDPNPDMAVLQTDMPTAVELFQKAANLDPTEDHLPGFIGVTTVHAGQLARDPALIAKGDEILDAAVKRYPEFNNFNRWAAHDSDPKDSPGYHLALESLWGLFEACMGGPVDRTNPDARPYLNRYTTAGRKKVCWWGNELAPYAWEGIFLNLGSGLVKAGQIDAARVAFANAKLAPNYGTWPYRAEFESIAGSDLAARAALYADADPSNDPPTHIAGRGCVYCHATVPER